MRVEGMFLKDQIYGAMAVSTIASYANNPIMTKEANNFEDIIGLRLSLRRDNVVCNIAKIQAGFGMASTRPRDNLSQDGSHDGLQSWSGKKYSKVVRRTRYSSA